MPAGRVIGVIIVALVIGLILNAPDIRRTAERQEAGWKREIAVGDDPALRLVLESI